MKYKQKILRKREKKKQKQKQNTANGRGKPPADDDGRIKSIEHQPQD